MAVAVGMPKLGMTMEEGTVVAWLVELHGRVERGAPLLVIESEKAEVEIEATASGVLRHIYLQAGESVPCGTLLAAIAESTEEPFDVEAFKAANDNPQVVAVRPTVAPSPAIASASATGSGSVHGAATPPARKPVAPAARKRAKDLGLDPSRVPGTGPGGRVTVQDVDAYAQAREALVAVGEGVSLEVPSQGEGDVVVLLPGFGTDVSAFARQIPELAKSHRVLGVNPRGVGLSDATEQEVYTVAQSAADVAALTSSPAHVIGTSLGAAVAIELALAHPEKVRSLALIAPFSRANGRLLAVVEAWGKIAASAGTQVLADTLLPWLFSTTFLEDATARERTLRGLAATLARVLPVTLPRAAAGLREWSGTRTEALAEIAVPTLVIGAREDLLTPGADAIASAIPNARFVEIPSAGHAVGLEAPDPVNAALLGHLEANAREG